MDNGSDTPSAPSGTVKSSQREVKSCSYCHRRKLRCDRKTPCSRCMARGIGELCQQEPRIVKGRMIGNEPKTPRVVPTVSELLRQNLELQRKVEEQERLLAQRAITDPRLAPDGLRVSPQHAAPTEIFGRVETGDMADQADEAAGSDLEILSDLAHLRGLVEWHAKPKHLTPGANTTLKYTVEFIDPGISRFLVKFHIDVLLWQHNTFHAQTFSEEHEIFMLERQIGLWEPKSYESLALYFAVLATAIFYVDEEEAVRAGMMRDAIPILCHLWLETSFHCLQQGSYHTHPSLAFLQTVCILPMIAYHHGHAEHMDSLFYSAIKHAARLGYNHLPRGSKTGNPKSYVTTELSRRVWACLCVWESFSVSKLGAGALLYPTADTILPLNVDETSLSPDVEPTEQPFSHLTLTTHVIAMSRLGEMIRELYFAMRRIPGSLGKLNCVDGFVEKLDHILDDFPDLEPNSRLPNIDSQEPSSISDYRHWSRFMFSITLQSVRIAMYRPFLGLSYNREEPAWQKPRMSCLKAAREILRIRRTAVPPMWLKTWHVIADTVLAGTVCATELVYGKSDEVLKMYLRSDVDQSIEFLQDAASPNTIAVHGLELLKGMRDREPQLHMLTSLAAVPQGDGGAPTSGLEEVGLNWISDLMGPESGWSLSAFAEIT